MKKSLALILIVVLILACALPLLCSCNKDQAGYLNFYLNYDAVNEFSTMDKVAIFPEGYSLYLSNNDYFHSESDYGYIKSVNAYIVTNGTSGSYCLLNMIVPGESEVLLGNFEIVEIQVRYGLIAVMTKGLSIGVFNPETRKWILPLVNPKVVGGTLSASIDLYCKILSKDYIAVAPTADSYIQENLPEDQSAAALYNSKMSIYSAKTGEMVGRVETAKKALKYLAGFDSYVVVTGETSSNGLTQTKIIRLNSDAETTPCLSVFTPSSKGIFTAYTTNSTDGIEVTYFGNGKFLVHQETAGTESAYFYKEATETEDVYNYWQVYRWIYQADTDTRTIYESDILMLSIVNEYYQYDEDKDFDATSFLKPGYSYVGYALYRNKDKTVEYDQFIIDNDFNIKLSLSHNFGMNFESADEVKEVSFYELILTYAGGRGVVQIGTGIMRLYDGNGSIICENNEHDYLSATYNDGMVVCSILDEENSTSSSKAYLFGAINDEGKITVPFIYSKLTMFTGFYAIGERKIDGKSAVMLVGKNGYEIQLGLAGVPNADYDLRYNAAGSAIYKTGCYVYSVQADEDTLLYGIKNTNPDINKNILCEAKFTQVILYSPLAGYGEVYAVVKEKDKTVYEVYKLN